MNAEHLPPNQAIRPFEVTHRLVFRLAAPMTLAYVSVPLIGVIDTAVIGQLGDPVLLGGIAVGAIVLDVVFVTFNFLRSGTTGLTAQAFGAADDREISAVLARSVAVAILCGLALLVLQWPLITAGVLLMNPGATVAAAMREYLTVRIWAAPFGLVNYALLGWFIGIGRSGTALAVQTIFAGLNIALSVWFVLGLDLGVAGVAWGSVLAEVITVALQIPLVLRLNPRRNRPSRARFLDRQGFRRLLGVNRDIMIRSFSLLFAFGFFTRQGAQYGEVILAANALLMHFFVVGGYFLDGFATAAEQLSGRAVGARFRPAFERVVWLTTLWGVATALLLSAVYALAGPVVIDLMTTAPDVRSVARDYLVWAVLTPLAGVVAFRWTGSSSAQPGRATCAT
jgi:MATE family multidrug resistance protein